MADLTQLYAAERRLESELDAVREQIREHINYLGLNKRIRPDDFDVKVGYGVWHSPHPDAEVRATHRPTGLKIRCNSYPIAEQNRQAVLDHLRERLLAMGWREE